MRRYKSKIAPKFVDGNCTLHRLEVEERLSYTIAHLIFAVPCLHLNKPSVEWKPVDYYPGWHAANGINHIKSCLRDADIAVSGRGWRYQATRMGELLKEYRYLKVASLHMHEFARRRRNNDGGKYGWDYYDKRAARRRAHELMEYYVKTEDMDAIEPRNSRASERGSLPAMRSV